MKKNKKYSIVIRIFWLLIVVIFLQAVFSLNTIIFTDIATTVESYSYNAFTRTFINRKSNLENFMTTGWSNISEISTSISSHYISMAGDENDLTEEQKVDFLNQSVDAVIQMISKAGTTGGFIILDDGENMKYNYSSIYLKRDSNINQVMNSENVMLARGPSEISKKYGFSLVNNWSYGIKLTEENIEILNTPIDASEFTKSIEHLGYWHISNDITNENLLILTYSMPIFDKDKNAVGVVGVEVSQEHLYKFLPESEFGNGSYGYILADIEEDEMLKTTFANSTLQKNVFPLSEEIIIEDLYLNRHILDAYPRLVNLNDTEICIYYEPLNLYVNNSPFKEMDIWLVGSANLENMTAFTTEFWKVIIIMLVGSLIVGTIISYIVGLRVAKPILKLSKAVSNYDVQKKITFEESNVKEIAELSNLIIQMQENILRSASRTDKILELLNFGVGSFEYEKGSNTVTVSQAVYKMIGALEYENSPIPKDVFFEKLENLKSNPIEEVENTYAISNAEVNYYKVEEFEQEDVILGVIEDVTDEVEDLIVLNYERNYDVLTGIFNRRAFHQKVIDAMKNEELKIAGFVMFDLDNLKYVNDTFGHDSGDVYIKTAATIINTSLISGGVVGRMSGDEFYAFLYGFETKEELMKSLTDLYTRFEKEPIEMPNSVEFKIRVSGGIAWYGDDSTDLEELKSYADFAMYKGKHSVKGELREFNKEDYIAESFMLSGKEELNRILDNELINFVFQPIIEIKTGNIFGYEALMRPKSEILASPLKLLKIASIEGKLWKIEKIAIYKTLELYKKFADKFKDAKLFINSIPSENLKDEEYEEIKYEYENFLSNVVIEITEQEQLNENLINQKLNKLQLLQIDIALDDYGSGYANDIGLIKMRPNIVKIDRSIISNVHVDPSRQTIVNKIIAFCKEHNICVLGEGIETEQELEYLIEAGIELAQGYYISRPIEEPNFDKSEISKKISKYKKD